MILMNKMHFIIEQSPILSKMIEYLRPKSVFQLLNKTIIKWDGNVNTLAVNCLKYLFSFRKIISLECLF